MYKKLVYATIDHVQHRPYFGIQASVAAESLVLYKMTDSVCVSDYKMYDECSIVACRAEMLNASGAFNSSDLSF